MIVRMSPGVMVVVAYSDDEDCGDLLMASKGMDFVGYFCMCLNRIGLTPTRRVMKVVMLANNVECKDVGIGIIKVKIFDETMKTLDKVRHVPELGRNLISLAQLGSLDYVYSTK